MTLHLSHWSLVSVPPLLTYARATRLPGQPGTIRVQWDHPRDLADAHQFPDYLRNLRLSAAWSDVSNASGATTWSSSRQVSLVDMSTTRSITFRNLSPSGVFRFKVWINEVGKPRRLFPMLVKNLVSFLDASPGEKCTIVLYGEMESVVGTLGLCLPHRYKRSCILASSVCVGWGWGVEVFSVLLT